MVKNGTDAIIYHDRINAVRDDNALIRPETDSEVASKLGVNQSTVTRVVKNMQAHIIYHDRINAVRDDNALIRPETDSEVASKLGVSRQLVNKVIKNATDSIIYHDRIQVREYYEENPDSRTHEELSPPE